ncbi:hypothetical protein [Aeoliella mucimassa]|uniref:Uncharacterized protein n=1 Tax=Aeoliella mucimassa TaxID=2527972 RepID=A0A518AJZ2_9BACT|nr:hypothetical protein [Aeoliella mucimassa]QDU55004.1 hypothetical protein Pan181_11890 [Aeoliella mucimassa]
MLLLEARRLALFLVVAIATWSVPSLSQAVPGEAKDSALEGLGDQLLDDSLLEELMKQPPAVPAPAPEESDGEDFGPQESPLERIGDKMNAAGELIQSQNTSGETKVVQQQIISELDQLIEKLNKQCKNCKGGQCNKPGQQQTQKNSPKPGSKGKPTSASSAQSAAAESQATNSGESQGTPGEATDGEVVKQLWGQLPERLRQQLLQSSADEFLPKYREQLQQYFRRLAEEQADTPPAN